MNRLNVRIRKWTNRLVFAIPLVLIILAGCYYGQTSGDNPYSRSFSPGKNEIRVLEDVSRTLSIEEIVSKENQGLFTAISSDVPNFGFSTSDFWLAFELRNEWSQDEQLLLEIKNPLLNEVQLYTSDGTMTWEIAHTGDNYNFGSRPIEHKNFIIPLDIPYSKHRKFYLRLNSAGEQFLAPLTIWNKEALADRDHKDNLVRGSYFGIIIFVLFFNLFIYLVIREKSSMYYMHYNLNLLFLQFSLSGLAFRYLWPDSPYLANIANPFFASMSILSLIRFSQIFLNLKQLFPTINRIFKIIGFAVMANALCSLFWSPVIFHITVLIINVVALLLNIAIFPVGLLVLRKGFLPARYFMTGFVVLILAVFIFVLSNFGIITNHFLADYGLLIGSAVEVVLLSFAIVDRFKSFKQKAFDTLQEINRISVEQNIVLEQKVEERTEEIKKQKDRIVEQNEEIISSIRYAHRIQKTLLPSDDQLRRSLADSFVMYKPKDIVSGDFYWVHETTTNENSVVAFAIADCTGHGVPGALMSVMGQNLLNECALETADLSPDKILNSLNKKVVKALAQHQGYEHSSDGMDICLYTFNRNNLELQFAGANNGLLIYRQGELIELSGDKFAIGTRGEKIQFTLQKIQLEPTDIIYSSTDGMKDQFGGERGKKLKSAGLREFLRQIAQLDIHLQKTLLEQKFMEWMGQYEQVDDVCVAGVRIR